CGGSIMSREDQVLEVVRRYLRPGVVESERLALAAVLYARKVDSGESWALEYLDRAVRLLVECPAQPETFTRLGWNLWCDRLVSVFFRCSGGPARCFVGCVACVSMIRRQCVVY